MAVQDPQIAVAACLDCRTVGQSQIHVAVRPNLDAVSGVNGHSDRGRRGRPFAHDANVALGGNESGPVLGNSAALVEEHRQARRQGKGGVTS